VGQLDRKFIVLNTAPAAKSSKGTSPASIVLLDQHAVHERIRYESLSAHLHSCIQGRLARLQTAPLAQGDTMPHKPPAALKAHEKLIPHAPALPPSPEGDSPHLQDMCRRLQLLQPVQLEPALHSTARSQSALLQAMGILTQATSSGQVLLLSCPVVLGVQLGVADTLALLLQLRGTPQLATAHCSSFHCFRRVIQGKACRGAIMFNQHLSMQQMRRLLKQLCETAAPMLCAHGRPAGIPVYTDRVGAN